MMSFELEPGNEDSLHHHGSSARSSWQRIRAGTQLFTPSCTAQSWQHHGEDQSSVRCIVWDRYWSFPEIHSADGVGNPERSTLYSDSFPTPTVHDRHLCGEHVPYDQCSRTRSTAANHSLRRVCWWATSDVSADDQWSTMLQRYCIQLHRAWKGTQRRERIRIMLKCWLSSHPFRRSSPTEFQRFRISLEKAFPTMWCREPGRLNTSRYAAYRMLSLVKWTVAWLQEDSSAWPNMS